MTIHTIKDNTRGIENIHLCNDGTVKFFCNVIGRWQQVDVWKQNHTTNGRDLSGNKIVHYFYEVYLTNGYVYNHGYTKNDLKAIIANHMEGCWYTVD